MRRDLGAPMPWIDVLNFVFLPLFVVATFLGFRAAIERNLKHLIFFRNVVAVHLVLMIAKLVILYGGVFKRDEAAEHDQPIVLPIVFPAIQLLGFIVVAWQCRQLARESVVRLVKV